MTEPTTPPAGWYLAPHANGEQRYWDGAQWLEPTAPAAVAETPAAAPKKRIKWWGWALIGVAAVLVLGGIGGALAGGGNKTNAAAPAAPTASSPAAAEPVEATEPAAAPSTPAAPAAPATPAAPAEPAMTVGQKNAVKKAEAYLEYTSFSRQSLIEQLEYEQFPTDDATFAVDHITVDWNEQAALKAKSYLDYSSFSRGSLIDQLTYEGFTPEQAEYGVTQAGL